jgi:hypothetical protein
MLNWTSSKASGESASRPFTGVNRQTDELAGSWSKSRYSLASETQVKRRTLSVRTPVYCQRIVATSRGALAALVHALNEYFSGRGLGRPVAYSEEL